jgi:hypothetical protein
MAVTTHSSTAAAAVLAGLIVAGGGYTARHDLGVGDGLSVSALARARLEQELPVGADRRRARLLEWHPPRVPHVHVRPPVAASSPVAALPAPPTSAVATTRTSPATPVTRTSPTAPVTSTSPVGGDDGRDNGGGDG